MNETALDHPLVREYLRELDAAFTALPVGPARELREQITAHLDEALRPDAGDQEVTEILGRLGSPGDLAAEATAVAGKRPWPARLGWRAWTLIAAAVILFGTAGGYVAVIRSTGPFTVEGVSAWWYPQDYNRAVSTSADLQDQSTVPVRPGHQQGFVIQLFNFTDRTQTVLGPAPDSIGPGNGSSLQITVSTVDPDSRQERLHALHYGLPGSIPPQQSRAVRVLWTSRGCISSHSESGIDQVSLRVRVGWLTRTEVIQLNQGFFLGPNGRPCG